MVRAVCALYLKGKKKEKKNAERYAQRMVGERCGVVDDAKCEIVEPKLLKEGDIIEKELSWSLT